MHPLGVAALVVGWLVLLQLILWFATFFGWRAFARHYATTETPDGEWLTWRSAKVGLSNYGGCMSFVVTDAGLYLRPMWLIRSYHRGLLLPWAELQVTFHRAFLGSYYELLFQRIG